MIGINLKINSLRPTRGSVPIVFDPDYQAILDFATTEGYTLPSAPQQTLQNTLLVALKTAGVWSKTDYMYIFANNGSQEFATINWKNPAAFQASLVNAPNFVSNVGFEGDGATAYINTNFRASIDGVNFTLNNSYAAFSAQLISSSGIGTMNFMAGLIAGANERIQLRGLTGTNNVRLNRTSSDLTPSLANYFENFQCYNRTDSGNIRSRVNGVTNAHTSTANNLASTNRIILGSSSTLVAAAGDFVRFWAEGGTLSDAEMISYESAIDTYMAAL